MWSPRLGSLSRTKPAVRRLAAWAALSLGWLLPTTGCQVEYAGMTLPSGKYMHDDVQYFPPGPDFPWANTQAATQRARMQAMGIDPGAAPSPGVMVVPSSPGAIDPDGPSDRCECESAEHSAVPVARPERRCEQRPNGFTAGPRSSWVLRRRILPSDIKSPGRILKCGRGSFSLRLARAGYSIS
jgi:hypothetical protein